MRTRRAMTISLPPAMAGEFERVRKAEHRTQSELVREALRMYFNRVRSLPVYVPTKRELRELEKGRQEMRHGEFVTIDELFRPLEGPRPKARSKGRRSRSAS